MREMKDSGIDWIGEMPANWSIKRLKQILQERNEKNNPIKSTNLLSLSIERGVFPYSEKTGGGNKAKENFEDYKLTYPNDIVLNSMNVVVGAVGKSNYFGCISPVYYTLFSRNDNYNIDYYNEIFQSEAFQKSLWGLGNGIVVKESDNGKLNTIRMRIPMEKLNNILLPIPTKEEQNKIARFLDEKITEIDNVIAKTKQTIEDYKLYKQGIISKAVTKGLDNKIAMKEINCKWVDKIPNNWEIINTKRFFDFGKGLPITKDNLVEEGAKVINYGQIHSKLNTGMGISNELIKHVNNKFFKTNSQSLTKLGDFIFADTSEDLLGCGNAIFVDQANIFAGYHTIILSPKNKCFSKYFAYLFMSDLWRSQIRSRVSGIKLFSITQAILKETTVIVPSMQEQEKITNYLDERCSVINKLIISKEKNIEDLEKYKKSLIYEYVTGKKEVI